MGFFSWNCPGCGESIKPCPCEHKAGQDQAVLLTPNGSRVFGEYDGYGRVGNTEIDDDPELWHRACWEAAGRPGYTGPSDYAQDQGYFYDCPECARFRDEHPWLFDKHGQQINCRRFKREDGQLGCEVNEECPHYRPDDESNYSGTCQHPDRTSECPLEAQGGPLEAVDKRSTDG